MDAAQVARLGRKVAAVCPAQRFNAETPQAWEALLAPVRFEDAQAAVLELGRRQEFIAPKDIIAEVRRQRANRTRTHVVPAPTPEQADDPQAYIAAIRGSVADAASRPQGRRLAIGAGERARQWERHGQTVVPRDHKPEGDRRPAPVRSAVAAAREACVEASRRLRPEGEGRVPVPRPPAWGHCDPVEAVSLGDVVPGLRAELEERRGAW